MTVTVVGTNVSATADSEGRFALNGVPPGPVQLHFTGSGTNAFLNIGSVAPGETITIVVSVTGTNAVLEDESLESDDDLDDDTDSEDDAADDDDEEDDDSDEDDEDDDSSDDDRDDDREDDDD